MDGETKFDVNAGAAEGADKYVTMTEADLLRELAAAKAQIAALSAKAAAALEKDVLPEETKPARKAKSSESRASSKERYRIVVAESNDANDMSRVFVSVNGRGYWLQRGVPVDVPREVVKALQRAVTAKAVPIIDERTQLPNGLEMRESPRFPFQNLGKVVDENGNRLVLNNLE